MKKILFLILTLILFGCQIYTNTSTPELNLNGKWKLLTFNGHHDNIINLPAYFTYKLGDTWEFDYNTLIIRNEQGIKVGEYYIGYIL